MACPTLVKKIECGIGASSHSFEKCDASIRNGLKDPDGVAYVPRPVETGQLHRSRPSTDTHMRCTDLSIVIVTAAWADGATIARPAASSNEREKYMRGSPA